MKDKTAIITGTSGGIGREVARGIAEAGTILSLWYHINPDDENLTEELKEKLFIKRNRQDL